jgi:hypothetical protein
MSSMNLDILPEDLTLVHSQTKFGLMDVITISAAKARLGRLADKALKSGQPIIIARGSRYVQLLPWTPIEPIPLQPVGALPVTALELALEKLAGPDLGPDDV